MLFINKYWKSLIWVIVIFILSSISGNSLQSIPKFNIPHFDKLVHFGMYFILTIIIIWDATQNKKSSFKVFLFIVVFSISYGALMEFMQEHVFTKRSADLFDFLANSVGVLSGVFSFLIFHKFTKFTIN